MPDKPLSQYRSGVVSGQEGYDLDAKNNGGKPYNAPGNDNATRSKKDFNRGYNEGYRSRVRGQANAELTSGTDSGLARGIHDLNYSNTIPHSSADPYEPPSKVGQ